MSLEKNINWMDGIQVAVTYCDANGIIRDMNSASIEVFSKDGGEKLIGKNVLDCHPEPGRIQAQRFDRSSTSKRIYDREGWSQEINLPGTGYGWRKIYGDRGNISSHSK